MHKIAPLPLLEAAFVEPMECLAVAKLPDGAQWVYEIKLDNYHAIPVKSAGRLNLFSRRRNSFNRQYPLVYEALADLPNNTVTMVR
jgi:ATP-dependent DNA ligase